MKRLFITFLLLNGLFIQSQNLKLMTYNIRLDVDSDGINSWKNRKDFFTSQIQFYEPDIFGVQEALPNQIIDISDKLIQYNHIGIGREENETGEASAIYFNKKRFSVLKSNTFWISETPEKVSMGWDAACRRVCTYGLFQDKKTKKIFWIFNTHLDHIGNLARTKGIDLIFSKIETLNNKKYPVFFMGDFNSEPLEERIVNLSNKMDDCKKKSEEKPFGPVGTFNAFKYNEATNLCIDYIFMSKNNPFKVKKYAVLTDALNLRYPSDHFPVLVFLQLK